MHFSEVVEGTEKCKVFARPLQIWDHNSPSTLPLKRPHAHPLLFAFRWSSIWHWNIAGIQVRTSTKSSADVGHISSVGRNSLGSATRDFVLCKSLFSDDIFVANSNRHIRVLCGNNCKYVRSILISLVAPSSAGILALSRERKSHKKRACDQRTQTTKLRTGRTYWLASVIWPIRWFNQLSTKTVRQLLKQLRLLEMGVVSIWRKAEMVHKYWLSFQCRNFNASQSLQLWDRKFVRYVLKRVWYNMSRIGESGGSLSMKYRQSSVEHELGWQDVDCRWQDWQAVLKISEPGL